MFGAIINTTPLTTRAANNALENKIYGDTYNSDNSFVSTLRALLLPRINDGVIRFNYSNVSYRDSVLDGHSSARIMDAICSNIESTNTVIVSEIIGSNRDRIFDMVCKDYGTANPGWVYLKSINDFFKRNFECACFINEKYKSTVFFVKDLNFKKFHQLQVAIPVVLPWFFDLKNGERLSELETELLQSLQEKTENHYLEVLGKIASEHDFENEFLRKSLSKIETAYEKKRLEEVRAEIGNLVSGIARYQEAINNTLREMAEKNITLLGLEAKIASGEGESVLLNYFMRNRSLRLDYVARDTRIGFHVNTYLQYFDSSIAERFLENTNSILYSPRSDKLPCRIIRKIFEAIFINETIKVRTCASYEFDMRGGVTPKTYADFGGDDYDRIPNPHINHYACVGDYGKRMTEFLVKNDYIGFLETTVASAMSLNIADAPVMRAFVGDLFSGTGGQCLEFEDGTQMDINGVIEYFKNQEGDEPNE